MKERPILFSAPMVRALLDGSKTQTRRVCKPAVVNGLSRVIPAYKSQEGEQCPAAHTPGWFGDEDGDVLFSCPFGQPGDRLWVRETWVCDHFRVQSGPYLEVDDAREHLFYRADNEQPFESPEGNFWKPSIHMPRWAYRILLEVVSVRVERLNDCSEADARAEGATHYGPANHLSHGGWSHDGHHVHATALASYEKLWKQINGACSWAANPWVWVVELKRVTLVPPVAPMSRSAGMRCTICCAKAGETHLASCPERR